MIHSFLSLTPSEKMNFFQKFVIDGLNENTSFWTATESKHKNYALAFQYSAFGFLISESPKFSGYSMRVLKI